MTIKIDNYWQFENVFCLGWKNALGALATHNKMIYSKRRMRRIIRKLFYWRQLRQRFARINSLERQGKHYMVSTSIYIQKILTIFNNHKLSEENHLSTTNNQPVLTEDNRCQLWQSFSKKYKIFIFNILRTFNPITRLHNWQHRRQIYKIRPRAWTYFIN